MTPKPLRRAAAIVALSVLAIGGGTAVATAVPTPTADPSVTAEPSTSAEPTVTADPSDGADPTVTAEPTTTAGPTATPEPTTSPEPAIAAVPKVDVLQPWCDGSTVVKDGRIKIKPGPGTDWILLPAGDDPAFEDALAEAEDVGAPGDVTVPPGGYQLWAIDEHPWGDLGPWQVLEGDVIKLPLTVTAFTGACPKVTPAATWTPAPEQLVDAKRGGFTTAPRVNQGGGLTLTGLPAGAQVRAYLFSVPTDLGAATVAADGTLKVTVPAATTTGTHRVAVYQADGALVGWQYVEVLAAGQSLAATGADPRAGALAGVLLVVAGGALVLARRRVAAR